jgi:hypothetical protein
MPVADSIHHHYRYPPPRAPPFRMHWPPCLFAHSTVVGGRALISSIMGGADGAGTFHLCETGGAEVISASGRLPASLAVGSGQQHARPMAHTSHHTAPHLQTKVPSLLHLTSNPQIPSMLTSYVLTCTPRLWVQALFPSATAARWWLSRWFTEFRGAAASSHATDRTGPCPSTGRPLLQLPSDRTLLPAQPHTARRPSSSQGTLSATECLVFIVIGSWATFLGWWWTAAQPRVPTPAAFLPVATTGVRAAASARLRPAGATHATHGLLGPSAIFASAAGRDRWLRLVWRSAYFLARGLPRLAYTEPPSLRVGRSGNHVVDLRLPRPAVAGGRRPEADARADAGQPGGARVTRLPVLPARPSGLRPLRPAQLAQPAQQEAPLLIPQRYGARRTVRRRRCCFGTSHSSGGVGVDGAVWRGMERREGESVEGGCAQV